MHTSYQTNRMVMKILKPGQEDLVLEFYEKNKDFLEPLEATRPEQFYTPNFQRSNLVCEFNSFAKLKYMRYWMFLPEDPYHPLGCVSFSNFLKGAFSSCMVGYKLDERACHQGFMYEALSCLLPELSQSCQIRRIQAMVLPENTASVRLLERLHFIKEGYLHSFAQINGEWRDHFLYTYLQT